MALVPMLGNTLVGCGPAHPTNQGLDVAIKRLNVHDPSEREKMLFRREVSMLATLRHPFIIAFLGASTTPPDLYILTELAECSLFDLLHRRRVDMPPRRYLRIAREVALGLAFLHSLKPKKIIHRDVKVWP